MAGDLDEDVQSEAGSHVSQAYTATTVATQSSIISNNRRITDWADSIYASTVQLLDGLIGDDAFFTGGVPFRFIQNPAFKKFIKKIRPSYELPTRYRLCEILDDTYVRVKGMMTQEIQRAKYISIATDAWTDINGQSVINFIVMVPKPIFFKAIYTKNNPHTAEYIVNTTAAVIREIDESKAIAVLTDNARANVLAWDYLQESFKSTRFIVAVVPRTGWI